MELQQTRERVPTPDQAIDDIDRISNEFDVIVQRLPATTEGDEREAVNLMLAHAPTCASKTTTSASTTVTIVIMAAERIL